MPAQREPRVSYNSFYPSWHETIKKLPKDQGYDLTVAIGDYCFYGIEPTLQFPLDVIFMNIKPTIDSSVSNKINGGKKGKGTAPVEDKKPPLKDDSSNDDASNKNDSSLQTDKSADEEKEKGAFSDDKGSFEKTESYVDVDGYGYEDVEKDEDAYADGESPPAYAQNNLQAAQTGNDPPMQKHNYPKIDWHVLYAEIIAAGFPDPGGEYRLNVLGRELLQHLDGLSWGKILSAVRNYGEARNVPGTWWTTNPSIVSWAKNHITRFLPENFNLAEYTKGSEPPEETEAERYARLEKELYGEGSG